jgi:Protein of unknown function (DUF3572)
MQSRGNRPFAAGSEAAREAAQALAIEVLSFLAADPASLERFMSLSGLDVGDLRRAAAEPGFFAGVLDFLSSDETLLLAFAANAGRDPAAIEQARRILAPPAEFS